MAQNAVTRLKDILDITQGGDIHKQMGCQTEPWTTRSQGPCRWRFDPEWDAKEGLGLEEWDRRRPVEVEGLLRDLSEMNLPDLLNPMTINQRLGPLAQWGLCYHHNKYGDDLVTKWVGNIQRCLQQQQQLLQQQHLQQQQQQLQQQQLQQQQPQQQQPQQQQAQAEVEQHAPVEREQREKEEQEPQARAEEEQKHLDQQKQPQAEKELALQAQDEQEQQAQEDEKFRAQEKQKKRSWISRLRCW
jgi:hypothetical protein